MVGTRGVIGVEGIGISARRKGREMRRSQKGRERKEEAKLTVFGSEVSFLHHLVLGAVKEELR